jgi:hypothetical protein
MKKEHKDRIIISVIGALILIGLIIWLSFIKNNYTQDAYYVCIYGLALGFAGGMYVAGSAKVMEKYQ